MGSSIGIDADDLDRNEFRIRGLVGAMPQKLVRVLTAAISDVEREAKRWARSGGAFSARSRGRLASTLRHAVDQPTMTAMLVSGVAYGRIQEFGGVTKPHIIRPRNGKVLAFSSGPGGVSHAFRIGRGRFRAIGSGGVTARNSGRVSGWTFAKEVHHPGSHITGKHYARTAFERTQDRIHERFAALGEELKK